jgi:hypothetical protein
MQFQFMPGPVELICLFLPLVVLVAAVVMVVLLLTRSRGAKPTWRPCPHCGEAVAPEARFCPHCGKPLGPEA